MFEKLKEYNYLYSKSERKQLTAESLRLLRKTYGLQQKDIAKLLQITPQAYQAYESEKNEPPIEMLVRLSFLYNVPIEILVQQNNFDKENAFETALVEEYDKALENLKQKLKDADPIAQMRVNEMFSSLDEYNETMKNKIRSMLKISDNNETE